MILNYNLGDLIKITFELPHIETNTLFEPN